MAKNIITKNKEDYLKVIYELGGNSLPVNNKDIALALEVSAPSVSEMIKKLLEQGYIEYTPYKGIILTDLGIKEASKVVRKHRLWEVFLVQHLGYSWDIVHEEAENLEHVTSSELEHRLNEFLNYPKACPHGNIIPREEMLLEKDAYKALSSVMEGEDVIIRRVTDKKTLLKYLIDLDLSLGDHIKVIKHAPYNGPITLNKKDKEIFIAKEAAKYIFVE